MKGRAGWVALGIGVLAAFIGLFFLLFEPVSEEIDLGPEAEARENPLLGLERVYTELGLPARSITTLERMPPTDHLLVIGGKRWLLTGAETDRVVAWVEAGGHLLVNPPEDVYGGDGTEPPLLFERLGIGAVLLAPEQQADHGQAEDETRGMLRVIDFGEHAPITSADCDEDNRCRLAVFRFGAGHVSAVAEPDALQNERLRDYAAWAWTLAATPVRPAGAWVATRLSDSGSVLGKLARRFALALASAALLLAAWAWRAAARFGPPLPPPDPPRRSLLEHLDGAGRFLFGDRHGVLLLRAARRALRADVVRRRPHWARLSPVFLARALAGLTGHDAAAILSALSDEAPRDAKTFVKHMNLIQESRRAL